MACTASPIQDTGHVCVCVTYIPDVAVRRVFGVGVDNELLRARGTGHAETPYRRCEVLAICCFLGVEPYTFSDMSLALLTCAPARNRQLKPHNSFALELVAAGVFAYRQGIYVVCMYVCMYVYGGGGGHG